MDKFYRMKFPRLAALLVFSLLFLTALIGAAGCDRIRDGDAAGDQSAEDQRVKDRAFLAALRTANVFCEAWRRADFTTARRLMSEGLVRRHSESRLSNAIVPPAGGEHAGYLLSKGKHLSDGRVAFRLQLFFVYAGRYENRTEKPVDRIVLTRGPNDRWQVDEFPVAELSSTSAIQ